MFEDDAPLPKPQLLSKPPLDRLGVEELARYIDALREEITRVEGEVARKRATRDAADQFFRKS